MERAQNPQLVISLSRGPVTEEVQASVVRRDPRFERDDVEITSELLPRRRLARAGVSVTLPRRAVG